MTTSPTVPLENIYNMDETGIQLGVQHTAACIVDTDVYSRVCKSAENRENATIIECISASGRVLSPMVIMGVKTHQTEWHSEERKGAGLWHYATSPNGYIDNVLGLQWLERVFHPQTVGVAAGHWRYLICDGHASHESPDFLSFAFQHKIYLLRLPAHTSHLTQPLDVGCFAPLENYYRQGVREMQRNEVKTITKRMLWISTKRPALMPLRLKILREHGGELDSFPLTQHRL
jgi:hypothetical protein